VSPAVYPFLPWCGPPPDPALIWRTWRLDLLVRAIARTAPASSKHARLGLFACGWVVLALALVSPICPLSVALFSARASQHVVLTMIAAPLVAAGLAGAWRSSPPRMPNFAFVDSPIAAAFAFAAVVWFWHAPAPYALTFESDFAYWMMHVTMFASAVWLWHRLVGERATPIETLLASLVSTVQMGFLGALITLAPRPLYAPHLSTTDAWGLTPLQDQQLGGAIMWVLGCTVFLAASMLSLRLLLQTRSAAVAATRFGHPV
jgi:putative membrane protein